MSEHEEHEQVEEQSPSIQLPPLGSTEWKLNMEVVHGGAAASQQSTSTTTLALTDEFSAFLTAKRLEMLAMDPEVSESLLLYISPVPDTIMWWASEALRLTDPTVGVGRAWREKQGANIMMAEQDSLREETEKLVEKWALAQGFHANNRHVDFQSYFYQRLKEDFGIDGYDESSSNLLMHFASCQAVIIDFAGQFLSFVEYDFFQYNSIDEDGEQYQTKFPHGGVDGLAECPQFGLNRMIREYCVALDEPFAGESIWYDETMMPKVPEVLWVKHGQLDCWDYGQKKESRLHRERCRDSALHFNNLDGSLQWSWKHHAQHPEGVKLGVLWVFSGLQYKLNRNDDRENCVWRHLPSEVACEICQYISSLNSELQDSV